MTDQDLIIVIWRCGVRADETRHLVALHEELSNTRVYQSLDADPPSPDRDHRDFFILSFVDCVSHHISVHAQWYGAMPTGAVLFYAVDEASLQIQTSRGDIVLYR